MLVNERPLSGVQQTLAVMTYKGQESANSRRSNIFQIADIGMQVNQRTQCGENSYRKCSPPELLPVGILTLRDIPIRYFA